MGLFAPRVVLLDAAPAPPPEPRPVLLQVAAEAVIHQDEAEDVLRGIRARVNLGLLAPRGGPLVRRFFALQDLLPAWCADPVDEVMRYELGTILNHHAMALSVAMDLAACEWRSARLAAQVDALDGLGAPARRLDELYAELAGANRSSRLAATSR